MADTLLHTCPKIRILATSREAFGIAGETLYLVPSLTRPDIRNVRSLEAMDHYEAIQLFIDRATSVLPTFTLTEENASSVAQICQHLDGIPLAIELAASKIRVLSISQIAQRLDDRFGFLTGGSRTAMPRHQTLQAAIQWSYNLLIPSEQTLFRRLSIFVGGWTLNAAESVCSDKDTTANQGLEPENILELLTQLVNKSLVMTKEQNGEFRFDMLETIRQYADEELLNSGEHDSLRDKHLEYFLDLAEDAEPHLIRSEQLEWLARLDGDYENLRTALEWSLAKQSPELSLRLCAALGPFWDLRGYWLEGSKWLKEALSRGSQNPSGLERTARIRALNQDARLARQRDDIQRMKASAEWSFALAQEDTDPLNLAIARFYVGRVLSWHNNDDEARLLIEQSLSEFRALKHPYWEAYSYSELSKIFVAQGSLKEAERNLQNLQLARKAGERSQLAQVLVSCAYSVYSAKQVDEARKYAEEAEILGKQLGFSLNNASFFFAELAWISGDYERAKSLYMHIQEHSGLLGEKNLRSAAIADLGIMTLEQGDIEKAQAYIEKSLAIAREINAKTSVANRLAELAITIYFEGNLEKCKRIFNDSIVLTKEIGRA
jgi:non-specific serine/threonine protein kinase